MSPSVRSSLFSIGPSLPGPSFRPSSVRASSVHLPSVPSSIRLSICLSFHSSIRSGVTRARLDNYTSADYAEMCASKILREQPNLVSFKSKNYNLFHCNYRRFDSCIFSRKRRMYSDGTSKPWYFHDAQNIDIADARRIEALNLC